MLAAWLGDPDVRIAVERRVGHVLEMLTDTIRELAARNNDLAAMARKVSP